MTVSLGILVVVSGVVGELRYEGICTLGAGEIWVTCPLGFLGRSLAARELLPQWWLSVALVVLSVILLGRVFCAWICPTVLLRRVFGDKVGSKCKQEAAPKEAKGAKGAKGVTGINWSSYSSYAVLGGVLISSYLFRFPVFCLFCPIGLFFGFLYAAIRAFTPDSLSLELVLFPVMLGLELWVLKSWCRSICPLGALLSIAGNLNRFLLPTVRKDRCIASKGVDCGVCERVCPEGIELNTIGRSFSPNSCTKCLECYEECPARAIEIAILR